MLEFPPDETSPSGDRWITLREITQIPLPCLQRASEGSLASRGLISAGRGHCDPRFTDVRLSKVPQLESVSVRIVNLGLQRVMQRGFRKHLIPMA